MKWACYKRSSRLVGQFYRASLCIFNLVNRIDPWCEQGDWGRSRAIGITKPMKIGERNNIATGNDEGMCHLQCFSQSGENVNLPDRRAHV